MPSPPNRPSFKPPSPAKAPPQAKEIASGVMSGARGDFVGSLGRKVQAARVLVEKLKGGFDELSLGDLKRKVHALGTGARLFRFDAMVKELDRATATLEEMSAAKKAGEKEMLIIEHVLDDLPALAWGESTGKPAPVAVEDSHAELPSRREKTALIVGTDELVDIILKTSSRFDCERTQDASTAVDLARAIAPDVVVIDATIDAAEALLEVLIEDPLTEAVPIVVLTGNDGDISRYVALGATRVLRSNTSEKALINALTEITDDPNLTSRLELGSPTLEELTERMVDEIRRAMLDGLSSEVRTTRVPLGDGAELMGAVWGSIARARELVAERTNGAIRFLERGPGGAIPVAPWLGDTGGAERHPRGRGAAEDVRLEGRRILVADDDPGVAWFIADLLRTTGCTVHEAADGEAALELAYKFSPDLIISDILMPKLDGFALTRLLKRDIALRDTPVILLSWKEDLLQRVRELGANASGYLRKESDTRAIVSRVREALWPRARVENRLRREGDVRGRLEGLTARSLLALVAGIRPNSRLVLQDASFVYEIELRDGAPRSASRRVEGRKAEVGMEALATLLAVGAGRFHVSTNTDAIEGGFSGSFDEIVAPLVAKVRGAMHALSGKRLFGVQRVSIDLERIRVDLRSLPETARELVEELASGASPRELMTRRDVDAALFEQVLFFVAARGVIDDIHTSSGDSILDREVSAAMTALEGAPVRNAPKGSLMSTPPPPPREEHEESSVVASLAELVARGESQSPSSVVPVAVLPVLRFEDTKTEIDSVVQVGEHSPIDFAAPSNLPEPVEEITRAATLVPLDQRALAAAEAPEAVGLQETLVSQQSAADQEGPIDQEKSEPIELVSPVAPRVLTPSLKVDFDAAPKTPFASSVDGEPVPPNRTVRNIVIGALVLGAGVWVASLGRADEPSGTSAASAPPESTMEKTVDPTPTTPVKLSDAGAP